jgi:hypothetical protein
VLNTVDLDSPDYAYYSSYYSNYEAESSGGDEEDRKALGSAV